MSNGCAGAAAAPAPDLGSHGAPADGTDPPYPCHRELHPNPAGAVYSVFPVSHTGSAAQYAAGGRTGGAGVGGVWDPGDP